MYHNYLVYDSIVDHVQFALHDEATAKAAGHMIRYHTWRMLGGNGIKYSLYW